MASNIRRFLQWRFVIPLVIIFVLFNSYWQTATYVESMTKIFLPLRLLQSDANSVVSRLKFNSTTHAYKLNEKPIIWQYWDKQTPPLYTRLLMEALRCRNPEFEIVQVHESNFFEYLPDSPVPKDVFRLLYPAHQADVFRLHILVKYGGVYVDNDVYPLDKLYPLYEQLQNVDLIISDLTGNKDDYWLSLAAIGPSRVNASHIRIWADAQATKIMEYFCNDSMIETTAKDPFEWTGVLYDVAEQVEKTMLNEVANGRTKLYRYQAEPTVEQLITRIGAESAHFLWSNVSSQLLPLNWAPVLFLWGYTMQDMFTSITNLMELFPEEETVYSVFVGCALLDCQHEYERLRRTHIMKTRSDLRVSDLLRVLANVNRSICRSVWNDSRVNGLEEYLV